MPVPDIPMNEESLTIQLDLTIPFFQEQITEECFVQDPKDFSLELELSPLDSILIAEQSDTLCNSIMNRYLVSSIFNLDVHIHGFEKLFNSMLREARCD